MDVFEAISRRHSYRGSFEDLPVSRQHLQQIVEAGLKAPSGVNAQTTSFVIVDDPDLVRRISQLPDTRTSMQEAKAFIACLVDADPAEVYKGLSFQVEDCSAAVENMLLAVTALGYATVWIDGWLRKDGRAGIIGDMLGVPKDKTLRVILPLGVPAEQRSSPEKKPFEERAWFNRCGR